MRRKFFRAVEVKNFAKKCEFSKISEHHFEHPHNGFFHCFHLPLCYAFRLLLICRTVTNSRALETSDVGKHFTNP